MPRITYSDFIPRFWRKRRTEEGRSDGRARMGVYRPAQAMAAPGSSRVARPEEPASVPGGSPSPPEVASEEMPQIGLARLTCRDIEVEIFQRLGWTE